MANKMTEKEEIKKYKNKIKELEEKAKRKQVNLAVQFFKKNKIGHLLEMPEKLQEFTDEIISTVEKYQTEQSQNGKNENPSVIEENQNE